MRLTRPALRTAVVAVAGSLAAAALAMPSGAVGATTVLPTHALGVHQPRSMVFAHDHLFLSGDDEVLVLDGDGTVRGTLDGLAGAAGEVVSADAGTVYVALRGAAQVAAVDTTTLAVRRFATDPCPTDVALVGDRLFYSAGCDAGAGHIASVDAVTGGAPAASGVSTFFYGPPVLAAGGSTLVAGVPAQSPAVTYAYDVSGATLTKVGESDISGSNLQDLAVSPDGETVYVSSGYPYVLRSFARDLQTARTTYETGAYSSGVALSPDGSRVAVGRNNEESNLLVFAHGTADLLVSGSANPTPASTEPAAVPGTLAFSADGRRVYALVGDAWDGPVWLTSASVQEPTTLTLGKVTSPSGRTGTLRASAALAEPRAGVPVTFTLERQGERDVTVVVKTDAKGVASLSRKVTSGGRLSAAYAGDDTHQPSSTAKASWTVSSKTTATLHGKHTTKHHKLRYTKASRVVLDVAVDPSTAEVVHVQLQRRSGGHWKTEDQSDEQLDQGRLTLQLDTARKHKDLRFVVAFAGDDTTRASKATSKTFVVG
ncbi:YncE family protein [Microlunatus flavus]|uniref:40-residue YVTN family beta-propeller repeat-containing protein n=1 Tax=Microlunatus flavus TaxID=1036181 RepID=A0A1H9CJA9_9ACTN|nr:hypothetical protein [Microlunatus flavus]SEQ01249.1 hypothetical protein SAMN05421756_102229 [Microlunatus flavus]